MNGQRDPNELGALWVKSGRKGEYMTGNINGVGVVAFRNDRKTPGSNQPDWRVLKAEKREQQPADDGPDIASPSDDAIEF